MFLGAPKEVWDRKAEHGFPLTHLVVWLGSWTTVEADGRVPQLDGAIAEAKRLGAQLFIHIFYAGDELGAPFVRGQAVPVKKGSAETKDVGGWWRLIKAIPPRLMAGGVSAVIDLEPEWHDGWLIDAALRQQWDTAWKNAAWTLKAAPNVLVMTTPGTWRGVLGSPGDAVNAMPGMMQAADLVGAQLVKFKPQHDTTWANADAEWTQAVQDLAAKTGEKVWASDIAVSSYAGNYLSSHPFPPLAGSTIQGNIEAGAQVQADVLRRLGAAIGGLGDKMNGVVLRAWRDVDSDRMDKEFGGVAERGVGLVYADGRPKPALAAVKSWPGLAPALPMVPKADLDKALADLATARDSLQTMERQLTTAQAEVQRVSAQRDEFHERLKAIRAAGGW